MPGSHLVTTVPPWPTVVPLPPVSRRSFHPGNQDHQGVPRRCGDLCKEPPRHVQPHLPSGEAPPSGQDQCWLQVHLGGSRPSGSCRWQLPGSLPGHRYVITLQLLKPARGDLENVFILPWVKNRRGRNLIWTWVHFNRKISKTVVLTYFLRLQDRWNISLTHWQLNHPLTSFPQVIYCWEEFHQLSWLPAAAAPITCSIGPGGRRRGSFNELSAGSVLQ